MELGKKIYQLRKLSGMTQEQLAEKLHITRQTLSKWENENSTPDVESVVRISRLFDVSLEELLREEEEQVREKSEQITLEDLARLQERNRKMNLLLTGGLLLVTISVLLTMFVAILKSTTSSLSYMLYRYMATGNYASAPVDYLALLIPGFLIGLAGLALCAWYVIRSRKG